MYICKINDSILISKLKFEKKLVMELEESDIYSRDYDERNCYKVMQFFHRTKTTSVGDSVYPGSGLAGGGTTDSKRTEVAAEPSPTYSSIPL